MYVLEVKPVLSQAAFLSSVRPLLMTRKKSECGLRYSLSEGEVKNREAEEGVN
jgi:hypothetical protein